MSNVDHPGHGQHVAHDERGAPHHRSQLGHRTPPRPSDSRTSAPGLHSGHRSPIAGALAAKFQDKYHQAHDALIGVSSRLTEPRINELLASAGVDMDRLKRDLTGHAKDIDAILKRNNEQAEAFGFRGTPSFIVGKYRVPRALSMAEFEQVIADARKAKMN